VTGAVGGGITNVNTQGGMVGTGSSGLATLNAAHNQSAGDGIPIDSGINHYELPNLT